MVVLVVVVVLVVLGLLRWLGGLSAGAFRFLPAILRRGTARRGGKPHNLNRVFLELSLANVAFGDPTRRGHRAKSRELQAINEAAWQPAADDG